MKIGALKLKIEVKTLWGYLVPHVRCSGAPEFRLIGQQIA